MIDGADVGCDEGRFVGLLVRSTPLGNGGNVGIDVGSPVGIVVGCPEGCPLGCPEG
jgi:hypothetical protein